jgi:hypothetical protein
MDIKESLRTLGIAELPGFLGGETLAGMQRAFQARLRYHRWNDFDGYEKTEPLRHMVQDVLTLDQGFVDVALHPSVKEAVLDYIGDAAELVEAKGWLSLTTRRMFHGWHGDAWYDQKTVSGIPRELKLGIYLSDVETGAFQYIRGTHRQYQPRGWGYDEIAAFPASDRVSITGPAGSAFLFDTSGIHGQSFPVLQLRQAVFFNYHDPSVPLQQEDVDYYRYHPLLLNAAFLGHLTSEDRRMLGFGNKSNLIPGFERRVRHKYFQDVERKTFDSSLIAGDLISRARAKASGLLRKG